MQCWGIGPHFSPRVMSRVFSQVAAGTSDIYSSYSGDGHSKLVFVLRCHDSSLVTRDNSGISWRLRSAIQMLLEVTGKTQCTFLFATMILGFLSIFNKNQSSSPFEAFHSVCLSRCQRDMRPPVQMRRGPRAFSRRSEERRVGKECRSRWKMRPESPVLDAEQFRVPNQTRKVPQCA